MAEKNTRPVAISQGMARCGSIEQHRYSAGVISFVIGERTRGTPWKEIGKKVKAEFDQKPTERQMRTWWKRYGTDVGVGLQELTKKFVMEASQAMIARTLEVVLRVFFPLRKRCEELGVPTEKAHLFSTLLVLEQILGREEFELLIKDYYGLSDKLMEGIDPDGIISIFLPTLDEKSNERRQQ